MIAEVNVGDFTRKYKCYHYFISAGDSRSIPRNRNWPEMWCKSFCTLTFHTVKSKERQSFVIPFHCRFKELIIFTIIYFFLYCPPCSVLHIFFLWNQPPKIIYWNRCSPKLSNKPQIIARYKPATFVKHNFSQVIFKDF